MQHFDLLHHADCSNRRRAVERTNCGSGPVALTLPCCASNKPNNHHVGLRISHVRLETPTSHTARADKPESLWEPREFHGRDQEELQQRAKDGEAYDAELSERLTKKCYARLRHDENLI